MSFSSWFFKASDSTITPAPRPETKQTNKTQDLIKELKNIAKDKTSLDAKTVSDMSDEARLDKCKEIFANPLYILKARINFEEYVAQHGKTEPSFSSLTTFFGYKTNQVANKKAADSIAIKSLIRKALIPKQIFEILCDLKDIHKEILESKRIGETSDLIEALFLVYQLPIDDKEFTSIKQCLSGALPHLEIYTAAGVIPKVTLSLIDKCL